MLKKVKCMLDDKLNISDSRRLQSMVALHTVSMLAQIGQFALGSILLPIALEAKKVSPEDLCMVTNRLANKLLI